MRILRFEYQNQLHCGALSSRGVVPFQALDPSLPASDLLAFIQSGRTLDQARIEAAAVLPLDAVTPVLPYIPPKIWCIGLNYKSHAEDINAVQPDEPGSFMKPASCLFGPGGDIVLPPPDVSDDVDAEGELGVIIGKTCRFVSAREAPAFVYGYTTTLDLTALDVLARNPRYLTRAKSIDTFMSFGPVIVTADEVPDVDALEVVTEHNGAVCSRDFVRNMRHRPMSLVAFHSDFFTWQPGDLLSTGCPKGARIKSGDRVLARIDGVGQLAARVTQGHRPPATPRTSVAV